MKKADLLSTLFVGIDISSRENVVALLDFESSKPILSFAVANNQPGAVDLAQNLADFLSSHRDLSRLMIALELPFFMAFILPITKSTSLTLAKMIITRLLVLNRYLASLLLAQYYQKNLLKDMYTQNVNFICGSSILSPSRK